MVKTNERNEIFKLIKMLLPQTFPQREVLSLRDLALTNVHKGGIRKKV